jgi:hypothetical protein
MTRRITLVVLAGMCTLATSGLAQFDIQVRMERESYLLYESMPVSVSVRNYSGRPLTLDTGEETWLKFLIADEAGSVVKPVKDFRMNEPFVVGPGQTLTRIIDVLPLYELRQRGTYRLQARISQAGVVRLSSPVTFTVMQGREIWHELAGLPTGPEGRDEYRLYTLLARRTQDTETLYISVQDQEKQVVYGVLPLGAIIPAGEPQALIDKAGRVHILFHTQPRSFGYVCVDGQAQLVDRAVYSDVGSQPQLLADADRNVRVIGGEQTFPRQNRPVAPEPPAPAPKPKKKWWWPFGPKETPVKR